MPVYDVCSAGSCPPALSLANEAQYLLINRTSVKLLLNRIINR